MASMRILFATRKANGHARRGDAGKFQRQSGGNVEVAITLIDQSGKEIASKKIRPLLTR